MLKSYFHKSPLIPLLHTDHESPEPPRIDFFLFGGFVRFHYFFSNLDVYESVPIQIRCRFEYLGESAGIAQEFITISELTLEHAARKLRSQLRIS